MNALQELAKVSEEPIYTTLMIELLVHDITDILINADFSYSILNIVMAN